MAYDPNFQIVVSIPLDKPNLKKEVEANATREGRRLSNYICRLIDSDNRKHKKYSKKRTGQKQ